MSRVSAQVFRRLYYCVGCRETIADHNDIIQKNLRGRDGRAFLFRHAMNVMTGEPERIRLVTGTFILADVYCEKCEEYLGWKYLHSYGTSQKYKEGYHVLEMHKILPSRPASNNPHSGSVLSPAWKQGYSITV